MNKKGPIVIIEDDEDDQFLLSAIFRDLNYSNEVIFFYSADDALQYLRDANQIPFIILSDINMPRVSGFELRAMMHASFEWPMRSVPYIFFTTAIGREAVMEAYALSVQGLFIKPDTYDKLSTTIKAIVDYWQLCHAPINVFELN